MAKFDGLPNCECCGEGLISRLVYLNGLSKKRVRQRQCPNHCDDLCPRCGDQLRITNQKYFQTESGRTKKFKCRRCQWKGSCPDADLAQEKALQALLLRQEAELLKKQAQWESVSPDEGTQCHTCGSIIRWYEVGNTPDRYGKYEANRTLRCTSALCARVYRTESVIKRMPMAEQSKWDGYADLDRSWEP